MKKALVLLTVSLFLALCLMGCAKGNGSAETTAPITEQTTAETTLPAPKVSLGVTIGTTIDENVLKATGIRRFLDDGTVDECYGIYVSKMQKNSPLDITEFSIGDIIRGINGEKVLSVEDIIGMLSDFEPGDTITVNAQRINILNGDNSLFDVEVTFPEAAGFIPPVTAATSATQAETAQ
jgi:S1-C subfamily serine protease